MEKAFEMCVSAIWWIVWWIGGFFRKEFPKKFRNLLIFPSKFLDLNPQDVLYEQTPIMWMI